MIEVNRPQMTIWRMRIAFRIPKATNTLRISNAYCFSTVKMIVRKRVNADVIREMPVWLRVGRGLAVGQSVSHVFPPNV
jgi:hypothetical protein